MTTIAAICTPAGAGAIGIIRVSGSQAQRIAKQMVKRELQPRFATLCDFFADDEQIIDRGIAILFVAPNSFTGEDLLELQAHGGVAVLNLLLARVLQLGAMPAQPGEFSSRAYLNNKIDLAQAEAIASLISAQTKQAAFAASKSLQGVFSSQVKDLTKQLISLRVQVEASIDFAAEEIDFMQEPQLMLALDKIITTNNALLVEAQQGAVLTEGVDLAIIGSPNSGKSSLLNSMAKQEAAIVTPIPGTTRDLVTKQINISGLLVNVIDTAGIRATDDVVELHGIRRAWQVVESANIVLLVVDATIAKNPDPKQLYSDWFDKLSSTKVIVVVNKVDLLGEASQVTDDFAYPQIRLSALTGDGINLLYETILQQVAVSESSSTFAARTRHVTALQNAAQHLAMAKQQLSVADGELVAEELLAAKQCLEQITGEFSVDDLLGKIFSEFCIGK